MPGSLPQKPPKSQEKAQCDARIALLEKEKGELGFFAMKEKKAKQDEIDSLNERVKEIMAPMKERLGQIEARRNELIESIEEIDGQLAHPLAE
ncbi:hypothetical protein [Olsenella intestinalis]|uniref:hypothetical protein n=1 Tax=Olsenella intestinalis TaxID=2930083 RepID=UPI00200D9193|nr:hypothetical protein [Olsenella intestinalis]